MLAGEPHVAQVADDHCRPSTDLAPVGDEPSTWTRRHGPRCSGRWNGYTAAVASCAGAAREVRRVRAKSRASAAYQRTKARLATRKTGERSGSWPTAVHTPATQPTTPSSQSPDAGQAVTVKPRLTVDRSCSNDAPEPTASASSPATASHQPRPTTQSPKHHLTTTSPLRTARVRGTAGAHEHGFQHHREVRDQVRRPNA